jgi:hypothetical protein
MPDSIELMIGKLQGTLEGVKEDVAILTKEVKSLPCATHDQMLATLNAWKKDCNNINLEKAKGGISLKNSLILVGVTNGITLAIALLMKVFS